MIYIFLFAACAAVGTYLLISFLDRREEELKRGNDPTIIMVMLIYDVNKGATLRRIFPVKLRRPPPIKW